MNTRELIEALAAAADLSRSQAEAVVKALFAVPDGIIARALRVRDDVQITGFGTFATASRRARTGRNPQTGETIELPTRSVARFRGDPGLKRFLVEAPEVEEEEGGDAVAPAKRPRKKAATKKASAKKATNKSPANKAARRSGSSSLYRRRGQRPSPPPPASTEPAPTGAGSGSAPPPPTSPRRAWPRVDAPDAAAVGVLFDVVVGLRPQRDPKVGGTGAVSLPAGDFTIEAELMLAGFVPLDGVLRFPLHGTEDDPHPTRSLKLVALADEDLTDEREIGVTYWLDDRMVGFACRRMRIVATHAELADAEPVEPPDDGDGSIDLSQFDPADEAGLTICVALGDRIGGKDLVWTARSAHVPIKLPAESLTTRLDSEPLAFLETIARKVGRTADVYALFTELRGKGKRIAALMPDPIQLALRAVAALDEDKRSVLIVTRDPYIPWELACMDLGLADDVAADQPFLGAHLAIGRWPLQASKPPPVPSRAVSVSRTAVVSAVYEGIVGASRLEEAEREAEDLLAWLSPAYAVEPRLRSVMDCFEGSPHDAEILHFALHGKFDPYDRTDGLILIEEQDGDPPRRVASYLTPDQVRGSKLSRPSFVFLNACQVGAARALLGDYAGMAPDFLAAGASAVVAPLWEIKDGDARKVALSFYEETLGDGDAVPISGAEFFRRLRAGFTQERTDAREASNVLLAYQFFGHPGYRLRRQT